MGEFSIMFCIVRFVGKTRSSSRFFMVRSVVDRNNQANSRMKTDISSVAGPILAVIDIRMEPLAVIDRTMEPLAVIESRARRRRK